jgi:hypothetical protein
MAKSPGGRSHTSNSGSEYPSRDGTGSTDDQDVSAGSAHRDVIDTAVTRARRKLEFRTGTVACSRRQRWQARLGRSRHTDITRTPVANTDTPRGHKVPSRRRSLLHAGPARRRDQDAARPALRRVRSCPHVLD